MVAFPPVTWKDKQTQTSSARASPPPPFLPALGAGRLGSGHGCEWYARGDGTTALFFTTDAIRTLAAGAGLDVVSVGYDRRLVVNRATRAKMHRVWVVATLRRPLLAVQGRSLPSTTPLTTVVSPPHAPRQLLSLARAAIARIFACAQTCAPSGPIGTLAMVAAVAAAVGRIQSLRTARALPLAQGSAA